MSEEDVCHVQPHPFAEIPKPKEPKVPDQLRRKPLTAINRATPQTKRLSWPGLVDLGEHIVGSRHTFPIPGPYNTDLMSGPATVVAQVIPGSAITSTKETQQVAPAHAVPMTVEFAPTRPGESWGTLAVIAGWDDGHEEQMTTLIRGSARELTDVPADAPRAPAKPGKPREPETTTADADDGVYSAQLTRAGAALNGAMGLVIESQHQAVRDIQAEAAKYKQRPAPRSAWLELAELALVIGTSGIASALGKLAANQIVSLVAGKAEGLVADSIGTAIEDGLKHPVEIGLTALGGGAGDEGSPASKPDRSSADGDIDFFSTQLTALDTAKSKAPAFSHHVQRSVRPWLRTDRDAAARALDAVAGLTLPVAMIAKKQQAQATAAQYVTYRARAALGAEQLPARAGGAEITNMKPARTYERLSAPGRMTGLLDILVETAGDEIQVKGARMTGVSQLVADRLLAMSLTDARVPVRIVLGNELGFITRDEAGRIRYSGFLPLDADRKPGLDETHHLRGAERIAKRVLAQPLTAWGVSRVTTDDASADKETR